MFWDCGAPTGYLTYLNFRAPLIFAQECAKINGSEKRAQISCAKINGSNNFKLGITIFSLVTSQNCDEKNRLSTIYVDWIMNNKRQIHMKSKQLLYESCCAKINDVLKWENWVKINGAKIWVSENCWCAKMWVRYSLDEILEFDFWT